MTGARTRGRKRRLVLELGASEFGADIQLQRPSKEENAEHPRFGTRECLFMPSPVSR